jgi:FixJ family two-component response regulator
VYAVFTIVNTFSLTANGLSRCPKLLCSGMGSDLREIPLVAVIEADDSVAQPLAKLIQTAGFLTEVFPSAEQFIRSNQTQRTGCLVLDVQLPGMSGLQLQSHLASAGRHIPIIFINPSPGEKGRALALELGAVDVLDKTSDHKTLLKEIRWVLKPREGGEPASLHSLREAGTNMRDEKL